MLQLATSAEGSACEAIQLPRTALTHSQAPSSEYQDGVDDCFDGRDCRDHVARHQWQPQWAWPDPITVAPKRIPRPPKRAARPVYDLCFWHKSEHF
jgi:hypothetical protein